MVAQSLTTKDCFFDKNTYKIVFTCSGQVLPKLSGLDSQPVEKLVVTKSMICLKKKHDLIAKQQTKMA